MPHRPYLPLQPPPHPSPAKLRVVRVIGAALFLFNVRALLLLGLTWAAVTLAAHFGVSFPVEFSFLVVALTFPVTFNIGQAFGRRERAIVALCELKASAVALYWQHRDWAQDEGFPMSLGNDRGAWATEAGNALLDFLSAAEAYLRTSEGVESLSEVRLAARRGTLLGLLLGDTTLGGTAGGRWFGGGGGGGGDDGDGAAALNSSFIVRVTNVSRNLPGNKHLRSVYAALSRLHVMNEVLGMKAGYPRAGEGGMSRPAQFLRFLAASFEQARAVKLYRTPFFLRHATTVLVWLSAVALAPYFVHKGCPAPAAAQHAAPPSFACPAAYVMAAIFAIVMSLLLSVQATNEMPFDGTGIDDIFLQLTDEFADVVELGGAMELGPVARERLAEAAAAAAAARAKEAEAAAAAAGRGGGGKAAAAKTK